MKPSWFIKLYDCSLYNLNFHYFRSFKIFFQIFSIRITPTAHSIACIDPTTVNSSLRLPLKPKTRPRTFTKNGSLLELPTLRAPMLLKSLKQDNSGSRGSNQSHKLLDRLPKSLRECRMLSKTHRQDLMLIWQEVWEEL